MSDLPRGSGPLADRDIVTGGPIDDPATADRANPRWNDPTSPAPDAQPLGGPEGTREVLPPDAGTPQDQAAQVLGGQLEEGRHNIREGRGDTQSNPALAEGGDG